MGYRSCNKKQSRCKIICFTDCLGSGGAQRQLVGLACMLKEQGNDVTVVLYYDNAFYKPVLDDAGVESVVIANTSNVLKRLWKLFVYFRKKSADVLIAYQEMPSLIACLFRPFMRWRKLIVSERNTTQTIGFKDKVRFWLWRYADVIVPNSLSQAKFITTQVPKQAFKVVAITNFVDTQSFIPAQQQPKNKMKSLVVVASNKPEKNFNRFVQAIQIAQQKRRFIVKWYGIAESDLSQCRDYVTTLGLEKVFEIYPQQASISSKLQEADFFCLPSLFEGYPNALCEAMSCGLPVACSRVCDNPYILEGGGGFLFDPLNVNDMAEKIVQLVTLSDSDLADYAKANREVAERKFSKERFVRQYCDLI